MILSIMFSVPFLIKIHCIYTQLESSALNAFEKTIKTLIRPCSTPRTTTKDKMSSTLFNEEIVYFRSIPLINTTRMSPRYCFIFDKFSRSPNQQTTNFLGSRLAVLNVLKNKAEKVPFRRLFISRSKYVGGDQYMRQNMHSLSSTFIGHNDIFQP